MSGFPVDVAILFGSGLSNTKSFTQIKVVKPHYFHKIYTPDEVYENPNLKDTEIFFAQLNKERIASNKAFVCGKACP